MNIGDTERKTNNYSSDYGPLEVQLLKGDSLMFLPSKSGYLDLADTRILDTPLAATILSASDGNPLLFTRTDAQQVVSVAVKHDALPRNLTNRMHRHDYFELSIVASGSIEMQIETQRILCQVGDVIMVNRNTRHAEDILRNATLYTIELSKDYLLRWPNADELFTYMDETQNQFFSRNLDDEIKRNKDYIECRYQGDRSNIVIVDIFNQITNELGLKRPGFQLMVRALIYRLFAALSSSEEYACTYVDLGFDGGESLANTAKQLLDKTKRKIAYTELSAYLHYSSTHINRVFQKHFGESVKDYNRKIYMREAAKLLTSTNMSIQEIIKEIGLDNRTHFYKLFFESYQMTPAEYRERNSSSGKG